MKLMLYHIFENFAKKITNWTGSTYAFITALTIITIWILCGSFFHYSDTWQLIINTFTTISSFLMLFLLQRSHNKDYTTIQMKLNEMIASQKGASNSLLHIEDLCEAEIKQIQKKYRILSKLIENEDPLNTHSIEEVKSPKSGLNT